MKLNKKKSSIFIKWKYEDYKNEKDYIILYCNTLSNIFSEYNLAAKILIRYISEYGGDDELFLYTLKIVFWEWRRRKGI